jgi:hypothetical protein
MKIGPSKSIATRTGWQKLIKALERVHADGDRIHLSTPAGGGRDLDEKTPRGKKRSVRLFSTGSATKARIVAKAALQHDSQKSLRL